MPIVRPVEQPREMVQTSRVSQVPSIEQSLPRHPETRDLYDEGFSQSLQAAATEFKKTYRRWQNSKEVTPLMLAWCFSPG